MMLLFSISVNSQTLINLTSIKGGTGGQIPFSKTTGTLTTLTSSTSLTYSNSILKLNPSVVSTETRSAMPLQIGGDFITLGSSASANLTPTFIEFLKSNGAGGFRSARGTVGFLGADEMNMSVNMNYTGAAHRYYDATKIAIWSFLGYGGMGYQFVPANNPNSSDIWTTYGCVPFRADVFNQPSTGKGIDGFSTLKFAQLSFTDITNTATVTATPAIMQLDGGILKYTGNTGSDKRLTHFQGDVTYNSNTSTGTDLNLMTVFSTNTGGTALNAFSYSTTVGYKVGAYAFAEDGLVNVGMIGKATRTKANGTNIGLIGVASNTNATTPKQIGGFFGLTGIADALPASLTSAALMADNGTSTSNILTLRDNATIVFEVIDGGKVVLGNTIRLKGYTVATLPAGTQGDKAFVTDALAPTYNAIVAGGGAVVCEVFYNGTNWITN
jgi:hypothetical protein